MLKIENGLIFSADITDIHSLKHVFQEIYDLIDGIKIGYIPLLSIENVIELFSEMTYVLVDIKLADIPATNERVCEILKRRGCKGITVHPFVGEDSLVKCVESGLDVFSVVDMTHTGAERFITPLSESFAEMSYKCGVKGFIVPSTRPETIKKLRNKYRDIIFLSPGIGVQGGNLKEAIKMGVDALIVGRSIFESNNPRTEAKKIVEELKNRR